MKTYGIRYLGSKRKLADFIDQFIADKCNDIKTAIDVFTGTTRIAQVLRTFQPDGIKTYTSDLSWASDAYAHAFVHNKENSHLQCYIDKLNNIKGHEGWISKNYCDVLGQDKKTKVRVWTPENGNKADAIRDYIETYNLEHWEKMTLITSLIFALNRVDNTSGFQETYLKEWQKKCFDNLRLELPPLLWHPLIRELPPIGKHFIGDALQIDYPEADLAYLDPPYNERDYSTYYHIWDSIVRWDKPEVGLATNRRIDRIASHDNYDTSLDSPWYSKSTAKVALGNLIDRLKVKYVIISYSNEGFISVEDLEELCYSKGEVDITKVDYDRYILSSEIRKGGDIPIKKNQELLFLIKKG